MMTLKIKNRALFLALAASAAFHLFWISAISVVIVPEDIREVKFSKVSFLGPVVSVRALDVRTPARSPSFLEKRFTGYIEGLLAKPHLKEADDFKKGFFLLDEDVSCGLIMKALEAKKATPPPAYYSK